MKRTKSTMGSSTGGTNNKKIKKKKTNATTVVAVQKSSSLDTNTATATTTSIGRQQQQQQQENLWKPIDISELVLLSEGNSSTTPLDNTTTATTKKKNDNKKKNRVNVDTNGGVVAFHSDENHYDNDSDDGYIKHDDDDDHDNHGDGDGDDDNNNGISSKLTMTMPTIKKKKKKSLTSTRVVERDLLGQPHEPMGIFYSLEVMDGITASSLVVNRNNHNMSTSTGTHKKEEMNPDIKPTTITSINDNDEKCDNDVHHVQPNKKKQKLLYNENENDGTKKKKAAKDDKTNRDSTATSSSSSKGSAINETQPKRSSNKKKNDDDDNDDENGEENNNNQDENQHHTDIENDEIVTVQNTWWKECNYAVQLHMNICSTLYREKFYTPTLIQSLSLPSTTRTMIMSGQRSNHQQHNLIGAAPTGSGKTLAFLIPIFHTLFTMLDDTINQEQEQQSTNLPLPLQALIITPTRELALQIYQVGMKFCISPTTTTTVPGTATNTTTISNSNMKKVYSKVSIACMTGGLAMAKQVRILQSKYRPPTILVGTPGRLWELLSSRQYEHLNDLSQIRFLIIDEADQMIDMKVSSSAAQYNNNSKKSRYKKFPELIHILDAIHDANPMTDGNETPSNDDDDDDDNDANDDMDMNRMLGLPGIPGEARVTMMNDALLQQIQLQQQEEMKPSGYADDNDDDDDDEEDILITEEDDVRMPGDEDNDDYDDISLPPLPPVRRQTFVFSATLTLPDSYDSRMVVPDDKQTKRTKHDKTKPTKKHNNALSNVHGAIADLLHQAHAVGRTKVIDLTNRTVDDIGISNKNKSTTAVTNQKGNESTGTVQKNQFQFPPGLQFQHILCTQRHKDSHLYGYILYFMTALQQQQQQQQSSILIFCNSIAAVRRVGMTLTTLRLPVRILHAHMQQRARFKAVESLQHDTESINHLPTIVVATDVAARGLDIPSVATVIHYDAARTVDTFIHRSGRTARGIGAGAVGCSLSIVASGEDQFHNKLTKSLNVPFKDVPIDGRLLRLAQERVNLACKVATADDTDRKNRRDDQWFLDQAKQAGLEVDDDLLNAVIDSDDKIGSRRNKDNEIRMKARQKEAEISRQRLNELLNQPVQTHRYGKFLSTQMIQQHTNVRTSEANYTSTTVSSPPSVVKTTTLQNRAAGARKQKRHRK